MIIRESEREIEVSGTAAEFRSVAFALAGPTPVRTRRFAADTRADPAPYDRTLDAFVVAATDGPVRVAVEGRDLLATGHPAMLARLAAFFEFSDDDEPGAHRHHEWWEGNEFIAADSRPMVVIVH